MNFYDSLLLRENSVPKREDGYKYRESYRCNYFTSIYIIFNIFLDLLVKYQYLHQFVHTTDHFGLIYNDFYKVINEITLEV